MKWIRLWIVTIIVSFCGMFFALGCGDNPSNERSQTTQKTQKVRVDRNATDAEVASFVNWVVAETRAYDAKDNRPHSIIIYMRSESNPQQLAEFYAKAFYNQTGNWYLIRLTCNGKEYRAAYDPNGEYRG